MEGQALIAGWYRAYTLLHNADCLCSHLQLTEERTTAQRGHLLKTHHAGTASEPGVARAEVCTLPQCWGNTLQTLRALSGGGPGGLPRIHSLSGKWKALSSNYMWHMGKDHGNLAGLEAWGGIYDGPLFPLFRADESVRVLVLLMEGQHLCDGKRALTGSTGRAAGCWLFCFLYFSSTFANVRDGLICWRIIQLP